MRFSTLAIVLVLTVPSAAATDTGSATLNLMPVPETMEMGEGGFEIDENFAVNIEGAGATRESGSSTVETTETLRLVEMSGEVFYLAKTRQNPLPVAFKLSRK